MTFKAYLKIWCMNRPVICSIRRASKLLLRPNTITLTQIRPALQRVQHAMRKSAFTTLVFPQEGTENTETQNRRKQTGGDIIIHLS